VSIPLTESREYNVIETDCSIGSIITTDGTNDPGIMLGCDLEDEMYGQDGNDLLEGGDGADYFDCGDGLDVIIDFEPSKGDTHTNNCKDIREHL
jgi:Ca2+-binding RTX toxin-like protein